jgi:hypothetical protein
LVDINAMMMMMMMLAAVVVVVVTYNYWSDLLDVVGIDDVGHHNFQDLM